MKLKASYYYTAMTTGYKILNIKNDYWIYDLMENPFLFNRAYNGYNSW